jgi:hypothetical protein
LNGWEIVRLWLYLLGGALINLVGIQLILNWILIIVLGDLSHRDLRVSEDMHAH